MTTGYGCEVLFGDDVERAERVQDLIETATGRPCPCKGDAVCPLLSEVTLGHLVVRKVDAA